ncbi:hypothetical protein [Streptomyces sp. NPDC058268]|uniref:hypothetical protein n=1 Tax=Streptomyces sp. NPDC058268 TaxID=3346413 RepID=UPI0036E9BB41
MGPDTGSARLTAKDNAGKPMRDTFTVMQEENRWHLVLFTHQPTPTDKQPASTGKPSS